MHHYLPVVCAVLCVWSLVPAPLWAKPQTVARPQTVLVNVRVDSEDDEHQGYRAMDGESKGMWHTAFRAEPKKLAGPPHPHEIIVDLRRSFEVSGFSYLPWRAPNARGVIKDYECYLSDNPKDFGKPIVAGVMPEAKALNVIQFPAKLRGRFFKLRALSAVDGGPFTTIAQLNILSEGQKFLATHSPVPGVLPRASDDPSAPITEEEDQYFILRQHLLCRERFAKYAPETFREEALVLPSDRDPLDIVLRRTAALAADLKRRPKVPDVAEAERQLARLQDAARRTEVAEETTQARFKLFVEACKLRRKIALANPLLSFDQIVFIKRHLSRWSHVADQFYGEKAAPGGGLYVLSDAFGPSPKLRDVLENSVVQSGRLKGEKLVGGAFLSPNLSYDGKTIVFAYVECRGTGGRIDHFHLDPARGHWDPGHCYHVFKVNVDGSDLVQLTDGAWNDFDPCWLPNGRIAFISERRGSYVRCGRACPVYTLYDMAADGSDIRPLSLHESNEWNPSVTNDGRIVFSRWDYVDRHGITAHHPWITTVDGRDSRAVHGNFFPRGSRPDVEASVMAIPGSQRYVATASTHGGQFFGSLVVLDPNVADTAPMAPVKRLTPDVAIPLEPSDTPVYGTAWPLSEDYYLCMYDPAMQPGMMHSGSPYFHGDYGIYLLDSFGNKELIYRDPQFGCHRPIPLLARPAPLVPEGTPPIAADRIERRPGTRQALSVDGRPAEGTMAVINTYDSLRPWPEGTKIKSLRVIQLLPLPVPSGDIRQEPAVREPGAGDSVVLCRKVLGTAPVEEDGSAHFIVPADKQVLFQALDERGLAIQSMRSGAYVHAGETLVCQGCHNPRHRAAGGPTTPAWALRREPSRLVPDVDGTSPISYPRLVQPVLDEHCVECHAKPESKAPTLAREPITKGWYASYHTLVPRTDRVKTGYAFYIYDESLSLAGKHGSHSLRTTPGKFGARTSKLLEILDKGHYDVKLSAEELHRLTVWMDCCSMFYGVYDKEGVQAQLLREIVEPTLE